jgi:hypothetical protein
MLEFQEWIVTRNAHAEGIPLGDFRGWIIRGRKMDTKCLDPGRGSVWIDMWPQKSLCPGRGFLWIDMWPQKSLCPGRGFLWIDMWPKKAFAPAGVSYG